jgi:predicted adenine nucleotide alpha hydrolase (AANH) superfamily ATPase
MKLLLHCCCAPCALSCVSSLRAQGIESELLWFNPNIHPCAEYNARLDCLREFAANEKLKLRLINEYGLRLFLQEVYQEIDGINTERCQKCYSLRMEKTASVAAAEGFTAFTTSLLISPYQDHDALKRIGEEAAAKHGVDFYYIDFRPLFREGRSAAREMGLYMQKYCGCIFSEEERYLKNKI